ncbi:MAG: NAD(P)H-dependent oxidoreductase [Bacillota bacterium]
MEITIIHGQGHEGSTYHVTAMLKEKLAREGDEVHEYFMPADGPGFCIGCFGCMLKGEEYCPEADKVRRLVDSILRSGIVIIDSPTYCLEMSGQLKTFFDHLGFIYMSHRPRKEMFSKTGIAVSTAAGAGAGKVAKSVARQMFWWGVPKVYRLNFSVNASSWDGVPDKIKARIKKKTEKVSRLVLNMRSEPKPGMAARFMFGIMRQMQKANNWNETDRRYWEKNGWLGAARPWKKP